MWRGVNDLHRLILRTIDDPGDGGFIPSTQRYYRRLFLLLNTTSSKIT
jgi:hypothetical protein